jgi:hypothetical protein
MKVLTGLLARHWRRGLGFLLSLLSLLVPAYFFWLSDHAYFALHRVENDEGFFVWGGWSIRQGLAPYRDFIEFKPPVLFITHAIAQAIFGLAGRGYRRLFVILPIIGLVLFQLSLLSRRVNRLIAATIACSLTYLFVHKSFHDSCLGDSESIGLGYFFIGFGLLLLETRWRRTADALGAFFMCAAVFSKEPYGPQVGLAWVCVLLLRDGWNRRREVGWPMLKWTLIGIAAFVVALCVYMVPSGAMSAYLEMAARYAKLYQDPLQGYCVVLGRVHPSTGLHDLHKQWDQARKEFFNLDLFGFILPLLLMAVVFTARQSWRLFLVVCATIGSAFWAVRASNCQWMHYYLMAHAGIFTVIAVGAVCARQPLALASRSIRWWAMSCITVIAAVAIWPRYEEVRDVRPHFEADAEPAPGLVKLITDNSAPGDRIFTTGNPYLYVQTQRLGATRYSTFDDEIMAYYPGTTDEEKLKPIYDELVRSRPALVYVDPERPQRRVRNMKALVTPFLTDNHYVKLNENLYRRP